MPRERNAACTTLPPPCSSAPSLAAGIGLGTNTTIGSFASWAALFHRGRGRLACMQAPDWLAARPVPGWVQRA